MSKESSKFDSWIISRDFAAVLLYIRFSCGYNKKVYNGPLCRIYFPFSQVFHVMMQLEKSKKMLQSKYVDSWQYK